MLPNPLRLHNEKIDRFLALAAAAKYSSCARSPIPDIVAGIISIGGGTSLGREGPSVQVCGGLASNLAGFMGTAKQHRRNPAASGAAAGLAGLLTPHDLLRAQVSQSE